MGKKEILDEYHRNKIEKIDELLAKLNEIEANIKMNQMDNEDSDE